MELINSLANTFLNWRSFKTDRKIIVIESDDWGGLRTNGKETLKALNAIHDNVAKDRFTQLDNIASEDDLNGLFDVLRSVTDTNGNPAVVTANVSVANPDFTKIKEHNFEEFFYEPFYETIKRTADGKQVLSLWKSGMAEGIFQPQLHGREHVHALAWLAELRAGNPHLLRAFEQHAWGIPYQPLTRQKRGNLQAALDMYDMEGEQQFQEAWLVESSQIFERYFGYKSMTFIPPAYTWHSSIGKTLEAIGVAGVQGIKLQYQPIANTGKYKKTPRYTGKMLTAETRFLVRNVFFEPASNPGKDWFTTTLRGIERAFLNRQPAIIGSHRINFIGSLDEGNRLRNLQMLRKVLAQASRKWFDVEFMSSDKLSDLISSEKAN